MPDATVITRLGAAVRLRRYRLGISQEQLAERADLHRTYIAGIEGGTRNVTLKNIAKLASALKVTVAELLSENVRSRGSLGEILMVEDNPDDVALALSAFRDANILNPVHVARDGVEALDYLFADRSAPVLTLLDLGLPKVDGLEVLRRMKTNRRTADIPVVVLTASQRQLDARVARKLGVASYMVKPVEFENLSKVIPALSLHWALLDNGLYEPAN